MTSSTAGPAEASPGALETLRRATSEKHRGLEALAMNARLLRDDYHIDEYRGMLQRMYGFYEPLARTAVKAQARCGPMIAQRAERLRRDLSDLGCSPSEIAAIPRCDRLPSLASADRDLGCAYVFEGAALGGRVITKHLTRVFRDHAKVPVRFFSGDGDPTAQRWRSFCADLDANAENVEEVCAAACAAFDSMTAWLAQDDGCAAT
jgi:heme oxygenase